MCAIFKIHIIVEEITEKFGVKFAHEKGIIESIVAPHQKAPVICFHEDKFIVKPMKFSLLPSWSKESKVKFATHNARIETVDEKATWRIPFLKNHCILPMAEFIEPIYEGPHGGNMVAFSDENKNSLYAACIHDQWVSQETGEVIDSFAILTGEPDEFVKNTGHDRQPIFLTAENAKLWLTMRDKKAAELKTFLLENRMNHIFIATNHRALKSQKTSPTPQQMFNI
jgi:putative SOS response-associated peptidase YedK